jgi:hypothetical protein
VGMLLRSCYVSPNTENLRMVATQHEAMITSL